MGFWVSGEKDEFTIKPVSHLSKRNRIREIGILVRAVLWMVVLAIDFSYMFGTQVFLWLIEQLLSIHFSFSKMPNCFRTFQLDF